jgi:hypothetical protein
VVDVWLLVAAGVALLIGMGGLRPGGVGRGPRRGRRHPTRADASRHRGKEILC